MEITDFLSRNPDPVSPFRGLERSTSSLRVDAASEGVPLDGNPVMSGTGPGESTGSITAAGWVLPVKHFSATSLSMLAVCPRQYQQRYIQHRKERPGQAQIVGNAFHLTAEYNLTQKVTSGIDLPINDLVDYSGDLAFDLAVTQAEEKGESVKWDDKSDAKLQLLATTSGAARDIFPRIVPVAAEREFSVTTSGGPGGGSPVPVIGKIDAETTESIVDLKTSKRKHSKIKPQWRLQGRIYQLAAAKETVFETITTKGVVGDRFVIPFTHSQWVQTEKWIEKLAWLANHFYATIGPDDPWPMTGVIHDWRCDWCAYKGDCPVWRT